MSENLIISTDKHTVGLQRKKKTKKNTLIAHGTTKEMLLVENHFVSQSRQLTYDYRIKKREQGLRWVI